MKSALAHCSDCTGFAYAKYSEPRASIQSGIFIYRVSLLVTFDKFNLNNYLFPASASPESYSTWGAVGNWTARIDFGFFFLRAFSHASDIFYPGGGGFDVLAVPWLETCVKLQISNQASLGALCRHGWLLVLHIIIVIIFSIHVHRPHYFFFHSKITIKEANPRLMHVSSALCSRAKTSIIIFVACTLYPVPSLD